MDHRKCSAAHVLKRGNRLLIRMRAHTFPSPQIHTLSLCKRLILSLNICRRLQFRNAYTVCSTLAGRKAESNDLTTNANVAHLAQAMPSQINVITRLICLWIKHKENPIQFSSYFHNISQNSSIFPYSLFIFRYSFEKRGNVYYFHCAHSISFNRRMLGSLHLSVRPILYECAFHIKTSTVWTLCYSSFRFACHRNGNICFFINFIIMRKERATEKASKWNIVRNREQEYIEKNENRQAINFVCHFSLERLRFDICLENVNCASAWPKCKRLNTCEHFACGKLFFALLCAWVMNTLNRFCWRSKKSNRRIKW